MARLSNATATPYEVNAFIVENKIKKPHELQLAVRIDRGSKAANLKAKMIDKWIIVNIDIEFGQATMP